jgi:hypothetical protein
LQPNKTSESKKENKPNRKVLNAKKVIIDGITFDSGLEGYAYSLFKQFKIDVVVKPTKHELIPKRTLFGKNYRARYYCPDFYIPALDIYVDTKGYAEKLSIFKIQLFEFQTNRQVHIPSTEMEVFSLLYECKQKLSNNS